LKKNELDTPKDPSNSELESLLMLYNSGQLEQASTQAIQMLQKFPNSAVIYNILAAVNAGLGYFDAAIDNCRRAIKISPNYAEAYNNMGAAFRQLGNLAGAIDSYRQALEIEPNYAEAYSNMGNALKEHGDSGAAIESYKRALKIKPGYAEAYYSMGNALQDVGDLEAAIESYKRALKIRPDYAEVYNDTGNALQDQGDLGPAIDSYKQAIKIKPNYVEAYSNLGHAQQRQGELGAAIDSYKHAIKIRPNYAEAYCNMGNALKEQGNLGAAIDSYKKALKLKPDYALAYNNMGNALKDRGDFGASLESYKKALKIKPDFADAYYNMGILFYEGRHYKEAARQFELSELKLSELYLLKCFYEQNDKSKFYDQLDQLIKKGEINSTIGSLCSRSEIKYKTKRSNPFCNDPLKYVYKTDLTEQCDFKNIFVEAAKNIFEDDLVSTKSQGHLTNGIQTAGNLFFSESSLIDKIRSIIQLELKKYRALFADSEEGLLKNWPTSYSLEGWLVSMQSGGKLAAHMHEPGWITGSVYINIPPKIKAGSGNLVLCIEDPQYLTDENINLSKEISVDTGSLCFFPSSLLHYTIPFESTAERIVLAFDMIPKP
jgi:tetratricopeptide (TPR) repeat protein